MNPQSLTTSAAASVFALLCLADLPAATSAEAMKPAEFIVPPEVFLPHTESVARFGTLRQFTGPVSTVAIANNIPAGFPF